MVRALLCGVQKNINISMRTCVLSICVCTFILVFTFLYVHIYTCKYIHMYVCIYRFGYIHFDCYMSVHMHI